ncbi:thymidine phosphorylase [Algirhabdus cladophorae]|uniref:thymidine phosphorylase n=1 Tax=Algirhabdus cladophorae TaxID=3377108 RepID=UPI003B84B4A4
MSVRAILDQMRAGLPVDLEDLDLIAQGLANGAVSDAQAGSFAMAVCRNGLGPDGRVALTLAMRDSGKVLDWNLDAPVIDKHSTGGIGDCISLLLAPALAACGAYVPMISGRGLGHTGGTLDKLESIPGLRTSLDEASFRKVVGEVGCAIVGATGDIAPADKRLYAVRDNTGTVANTDLITASILSKKLAAGLDALVLDIKLGSGAFMQTMEEAETLAHALVDTAAGAGCPTRALITDMSQPLAKSMGNTLEVMEALQALTGDEVDQDLPDLAASLGGELLEAAGLADTVEDGANQIMDSFYDGTAAETFQRMVAAMGGPKDFVSRWHDRLPAAPVVREVMADRSGFVTAMQGQMMGDIVVALGGGRRQMSDRIDPSVGMTELASLGDYVDNAVPLALIHAASETDADMAEDAVRRAMTIADEEPVLPPTVYQRIT